jgi:hypothetical protein
MSFATEQVAALQLAYANVLKGQTVRYGERQLTMAEAPWISAELDKWMRIAANETAAAAGRTPGIAIADFSGGACDSDFRRGC